MISSEHLIRSITTLTMALFAGGASANQYSERLTPPADMAFANTYFTFELARNTPLNKTQSHYLGGEQTYVFGYRYTAGPKWQMGLSTNFKALQEEATGERFSLWAVSHETNFITRLYHPFYLLTGVKFMFLLPTKSNSIPPEREPEINSEVGAAFSVSLVGILSSKHYLNFRMDRWRGTKTTKFNGIEVAVGIGVAL